MNKFLLVLAMLMSVQAVFADASLTKQDSAAELIEKSGVKLQIEKMPEMLNQQIAMMERQGGPMPSGMRQRFRDAALKSHDPKLLLPRVTAGVAEAIPPEDRHEILKFLDSPLGRKVIAAENAMASNEAMDKLEKEGPALMEKLMKDDVRLALIQSLDKATRATDMATDLNIATALATEYGLISQSNMPQKPSFEQLRSAYEQRRLPIRMQMAQVVLTGMAMSYRDLSNEELAGYLAFANSPVGKKYFLGISRVINRVLVDAAADLGKALSDADKGAI